MAFDSFGIQVVKARTEEFTDSNNNLHVSLQAPDNWNSGTASATVHNLNWRASGLAATNDDGSAFFVLLSLPPLANMMIPIAEKTGLFSTLLSQYVTLNSQYDVTFNGYSGHAYSISATSDQLSRLPSFPTSINKEFDAVLITTQQQGSTYLILYATSLGRMGDYQGVFQNILSSVSFGASASNSAPGGNITGNMTATGGNMTGNMTSTGMNNTAGMNATTAPAAPGMNKTAAAPTNAAASSVQRGCVGNAVTAWTLNSTTTHQELIDNIAGCFNQK
jgi:hypothetical protein